MAGHLMLGPVIFRDYELPGRLDWGGTQRLTVHRLPGGGRVVDAMGRDDMAVAWSGIFSGEDGPMRARLLNLLRADGQALALSWGSFLYSVVISRFAASYERANWLPYRIECTVLQDEVDGLAESVSSLAADLAADLDMVAQGSDIDTGAALAALGVDGALTYGGDSYVSALTEVRGVSAEADRTLTAADVGMMTSAPQTAADLAAAAAAAGRIAGAAAARGYARRAYASLANADS